MHSHPLLPKSITAFSHLPAVEWGDLSLNHGTIMSAADTLARQLAQKGIGRGDIVAFVLSNSVEAVIAFLAITKIASAAPLNPVYGEEELKFYLGDLKAKVVICPRVGSMAVKRAANQLSVEIMEVTGFDSDSAHLSFTGVSQISDAAEIPLNQPSDYGLYLHTSGTTARPKLVGLKLANLEASAQNILQTLALNTDDKCLVIMPLFHIHGLIATLLAPLAAGGSVAIAGNFNPLTFYKHLKQFKPTWYSGVPSMHQAIVSRAKRNQDILDEISMRFVRSSSAALAPAVAKNLSSAFDCPVIEAYGMTEASHQIASNGLDDQSLGAVGFPTNVDLKIADERGCRLPNGVEGEVLIKGANVHDQYIENEEANSKSFVDGYFRTGDLGVILPDGALKLTGRLKEIINRGGEKIAPLELDNIALQNPSILEAIAFAIPHDKLGEDIALAVVLKEGESLSADDITSYFSTRVAAFKVPRSIIFLDTIPKGATGKIQRLKLAEQLGLGYN